MPALAFGLNAIRPPSGLSKTSQKRKAAFDEGDPSDEDEPVAAVFQAGPKKTSKPLNPLNPLQDHDDEVPTAPRTHKSPKLTESSTTRRNDTTDEYTNLSALRSAKLHDEQASQVESSVYDYDGVYETFQASKQKKTAANGEPSGPRYMTSLLTSAEQRKRDQLRAREKLLQREREQEGDEFADKEKFVTSAYKRQQDEMKLMEAEEKKKAEEEEERRRKGMGMTDWNRRVLQKDEERMQMIAEEEQRRKEEGAAEKDVGMHAEEDTDESKMAKELNEKGGHIVINDEGEVIDKRQLLFAGLNTAPKRPGQASPTSKVKDTTELQDYSKSGQAKNAREAQRERQSRMMERQLEEMTAKQQEAEAEEEKAREEKTKSKITEADKMGAKERYLQRKKEREEEARKAKEAKAS
jgi:coiled-coil domain-containing protein 55